MVLSMEHKVIFLKGANVHSHNVSRLPDNICAHTLPEKGHWNVGQTAYRPSVFCNMEASNILDKTTNILLYVMTIEFHLYITTTGCRLQTRSGNSDDRSLGGQVLIFQCVRCRFFIETSARALMSPHVPTLAEGLWAPVAAVRPFSGVCAHMHPKIVELREVSAAPVTDEGSFMQFLVQLQLCQVL